MNTEAESTCDLFCFGHGAAALCVISLSPGWLTRPVGFGCHTHSIQLAQSRTVQDTLAPCRLPPTTPPLTLGLSLTICRCKCVLRLSLKKNARFSLQIIFFNLFFLKDDNLNDPMVLKKEGFCNCNCIKSKWIKHFEYSFNNCSTANVVVANCVVRGQSGL